MPLPRRRSSQRRRAGGAARPAASRDLTAVLARRRVRAARLACPRAEGSLAGRGRRVRTIPHLSPADAFWSFHLPAQQLSSGRWPLVSSGARLPSAPEVSRRLCPARQRASDTVSGASCAGTQGASGPSATFSPGERRTTLNSKSSLPAGCRAGWSDTRPRECVRLPLPAIISACHAS